MRNYSDNLHGVDLQGFQLSYLLMGFVGFLFIALSLGVMCRGLSSLTHGLLLMGAFQVAMLTPIVYSQMRDWHDIVDMTGDPSDDYNDKVNEKLRKSSGLALILLVVLIAELLLFRATLIAARPRRQAHSDELP